MTRRLFFLLRTGPGTAVIGGPSMLLPTCPFMQPFAKMSLKQREIILQYWASGPIPLLRKVSTCPGQRPRSPPCSLHLRNWPRHVALATRAFVLCYFMSLRATIMLAQKGRCSVSIRS